MPVASWPSRGHGRPLKSFHLVRITRLLGNECIPCSRCDGKANVLLFNGDRMASASLLIFLCRGDLSSFLSSHPQMMDDLIDEIGFDEVRLMLD